MKSYDIVVIGAGFAGMTAAIYAARAGKSILVLEGRVHGGQIIQTFGIANWPGEPGVSGVDLSNNIYHQMNNLGVEIEYETVTSVEQTGVDDALKRFLVKTDDAEYSCGAIIVAVGSKERRMGVPREEELTGRGVSYCATCDGAFYKGKNVAVVGGGNTAFYDALYLADLCERVYLVHRRNEFRADKALVDKLKARKNVEFVTPYVPKGLVGEKKVEGLVVNESASEAERTLSVSGVFVAVGRTPETDFLKGAVELDANGYVVASEDCHTSVPGIFAAGDVRTKGVRQLVTAAGDGAVAATEAARYVG